MYLPVSVACERCEDAIRGFRNRVGGFLIGQEALPSLIGSDRRHMVT